MKMTKKPIAKIEPKMAVFWKNVIEKTEREIEQLADMLYFNKKILLMAKREKKLEEESGRNL